MNAFLRPLLALMAGGVLPLAFAPFSFAPAAFISLAVLFALWTDRTPGQAFRLGYIYGLGAFGLGASWTFVSFSQFGGMTPLLAGIGTGLFVLIMSLYPALAGWAVNRWFAQSDRLRWLFWYPIAWVFGEFLRGWVLTGFNWLNAGNAFQDTPLAGYGPLGGGYLMSLAVAMTAGVIWTVTRPQKAIQRTQALALLVAVWAGGWLLQLVEWSVPAGDAVDVALIQGNIPQAEKWLTENRLPTMRKYWNLSEEHFDADVVIWPETAVPAYRRQVERQFIQPLAQAARESDTRLILGIPTRDTESGQFFNSMIAIGTEEDQSYHKRHLVPFGEYLPFKPVFGLILDFLNIPLSDFSEGTDDQPLITMAGYPVGISICYEDAYGREVADTVPQAAWLVNASNDAWFGDSLAPPQHLEIARMRALEASRPMMRVTNNGISAFIDHRGNILQRSEQFVTVVLRDKVVPRQGATPYALVGDWALLPLLAIALAYFAWQRRKYAAEPAFNQA